MAIEPQVFNCFGRPDKDTANALAYEFWKNQIECYNYLAKPIEDRLSTELDHRALLTGCRLFVALLSPEVLTRRLAVEEIALAAQCAELSGGLFCQSRAYVLTTTDSMQGRLPKPDLLFTADRLADVPGLVHALTDHMGSEFTSPFPAGVGRKQEPVPGRLGRAGRDVCSGPAATATYFCAWEAFGLRG